MRRIRTVVMTGATGAVGQALCRLLLSKEIEIYAPCRKESRRVKNLPQHPLLHIVSCDLSELQTLPLRLPELRADVFYHFGWAGNDGSNRDNTAIQAENIQYTLDACEAAAQLGCTVWIGTGSQAEYGRVNTALTAETPCFPEIGYGIAKLCAGQFSRLECRKRGIEHIWTRLLSVYGPYEQATSMTVSTITKLLSGETPAMTAGEQIWDYLYADDAAEALLRMAYCGHDGAVYPLGSGSARPLREYVEELRDAVDPAAEIRFGAVPYAPNQIMHLEADIRALTADTGFIPQVSFSDGIRRTVEWVRKGNVIR